MQVHAVLDSERATDSSGRKLPWAYEFADSDQKRRIPEEKGPFGKARKRGTSRSKTATPARRDDQNKNENLKYVDSIFGGSTRAGRLEESLRERKSIAPSTSLPVSASAPNLIETGGLGTSFAATTSSGGFKEPTEVILYGFGGDAQWAAIDFYEKASSGMVYEDYDRHPPNARYNFTMSQQKESSLRSLSKSSISRIRSYVGGEHWIKVTFDSAEAAERACHFSPRPIQGFQVHAERFRGTGPAADQAIPAAAGSRSLSQTTSPQSSTTMQGPSSATLSSNTATETTTSRAPISRSRSQPEVVGPYTGAFPTTAEEDEEAERALQAAHQQTLRQNSALASRTKSSQTDLSRAKLRLRAKPGVLQPQEKAFLPAASHWQRTFGSWPIIGWIVGSKDGFIGDQVPRKEDGSFDSQNASLYWRTWYGIDSCLGTDFCGVKEAEYDD